MHGFRTKRQRGQRGESHGPSPNAAPPRVELEAGRRTHTGEGGLEQLIPGADGVVGDAMDDMNAEDQESDSSDDSDGSDVE